MHSHCVTAEVIGLQLDIFRVQSSSSLLLALWLLGKSLNFSLESGFYFTLPDKIHKEKHFVNWKTLNKFNVLSHRNIYFVFEGLMLVPGVLGFLFVCFVLVLILFLFSKNLQAGECPTNSAWKQVVSFFTISNTCLWWTSQSFFSYRNLQNWRTSKIMRYDRSHLGSEHKCCNVKASLAF